MNVGATLLQEETTEILTETVRDEWLVLETGLSQCVTGSNGEKPSLETLLHWNGLLVGGAKFVLRPDRQVCLRAELPWAEERISSEARDAAAAGIGEGYELWKNQAANADVVAGTALSVRFNDSTIQRLNDSTTLQRFNESGWNVIERPDGSLVADLEVASGLYQVQCESLPAGGYRLVTELAVLESVSAASSRAVAVLLLLAGAAVRWARPAMITNGSQCLAVFEVFLPASPAPADIADALSSLSVAGQLCGEAMKALLSENIARDYLEAGAWLT